MARSWITPSIEFGHVAGLLRTSLPFRQQEVNLRELLVCSPAKEGKQPGAFRVRRSREVSHLAYARVEGEQHPACEA